MSGFFFLIFLYIWSLQHRLNPLASPTSNAHQTQNPSRIPIRIMNGLDTRNKSAGNKKNIDKDNRQGKFHNDDFGIDGLLNLVDNLKDYDAVGDDNFDEAVDEDFDETNMEDLETYDPISDTVMSNSRGGKQAKGIRKNFRNFEMDADGDSHRFDIVRTDYFNNNFVNPFNGSLVSTGTRKSNHNYDIDSIFCPEKCACEGTKVDCVGKNLTSVPKGISALTTWLDLSMNSLQKLPEDTFVHMAALKELRCVGNNLTELPHRLFKHNSFLQLLNFQGNFFSRVPPRTFQNLSYLQELHLDANEITTIPRNAFVGLVSLKQLWLDANKLNHIPSAAFQELTGLQALTLIKNEITHLPDYVFRNNTRLQQLRLGNNAIQSISEHAFYGLSKLKYLQLQHNKIRDIPSALSHLESLVELDMKYNLVSNIPDKSFQMKANLKTLSLEHNPIIFVAQTAFTNLPSLLEIKLSDVYDMTEFPDLKGTINLTVLQIDRGNIKSIPKDLCDDLKKLRNFDMHSNKIKKLHPMSQCTFLNILNIGNNELTSVDGQLFLGMENLKDVTLSFNFIHTISEDTFVGLHALEYLNLAKNHISAIHPNAFLPLKSLKELNLGNNKIHQLPTAGLINLQILKISDNPELREFPPKENFPNVNHFVLSYAYHCCEFILSKPEQIYLDIIREHVVWMEASESEQLAMWELENDSRMGEMMADNFTIDEDLWDHLAETEFDLNKYEEQAGSTYLEDHLSHAQSNDYLISKAAISCKPTPGPFMPCDDLFGWWSLRCGVWFVFMLALLGNGVVFFVSVTSKSKMDVPRFLICNLAVADFFMGIYLGILAIMDASTLGHFKKYAIQWQMSAGCLVAGTLGVLSSELSVYTLTVITLERFYAITHAMQLNKRLSLKHASFIMICGWIWSFGLAILPLFGISDYRKFAVCLPFEIGDLISKCYVCFIMVFNGISFFIIMGCYLIMYISIRDSQAWNSNDTRVAKRMALLVFTDFLCWAPIAFLSLAAAFGKNLIELNEAKVLTIFILPLNSCANPFLYAFFTKQFKKDCVLLCRRLEDSFLAKHFSQVTQRNVSMSWKYQRRPSALHSLMGESKSNNSQNNSTGSNSCGLLNYNSEMSSGSNKAVGKDTMKSDMYITQATIYNVGSNGGINTGTTYYKHAHKYKLCPSAGNDEDDNIVKNTYADISDADNDSDDGNDDIQVILHQDFYSQRTGTVGYMAESCIDNESENYFIPSSQKSFNDFHNSGKSINAYSCLQYPDIVIFEDVNTSKDENKLWKSRSHRNSDLEMEDMSYKSEYKTAGYTDQLGHNSDHDKWKVVKVNKNEKQINEKKQNNLSYLRDKSNMVNCITTDKVIEGSNSHTLSVKCSLTGSNVVCYDDQSKQKSVTINEKQKTSDSKNKHMLLSNHCERKCIKSNPGKLRENLQCCIMTTNPVEDMSEMPAYITDSFMSESETWTTCKHVNDLEYVLYIPKEIKNDNTKIANKGTISDNSNNVFTVTEDQFDNSPVAVVILLERKQGEITNSIMKQQEGIKVPVQLTIGCYTKQSLTQTSTCNFYTNISSVLNVGEEPKQLNTYHHQFYKELPVLTELCSTCDKHIITETALNKWVHMKPSPVQVSRNNALNPGLLQQKKIIEKNVQLQYCEPSKTGCKTLSKINSLVELSQIDADMAKVFLQSSVKRQSLSPNQECCMLLHGETHNCLVQSLQCACSNLTTYSLTCEDDDSNDDECSHLLSLELNAKDSD